MDTKEYYGGTYPEPPEKEEKSIKIIVYKKFEKEYDVPKDWDENQIVMDIQENFDDFDWDDEEIEDIMVGHSIEL